jgi:AAA+ ATPase superfamily predicted ATPase
MFADREFELGWLQEGWDSGKAQLRILYGRRRVGKSRLLDEFAQGKPAVVYQAAEGATADQLRDLTGAILAHRDDPVLRAAPLANWDAALAYLGNLAATERLLVIFDEYQYAAEADPTLASHLQRWWSREAVRLPIYLVLCGSYIRFFVRNVLTGPAYGRNTGALQLHPLGYREAGAFFPGWSPADRLRAYAVVGGVPHYLKQFDPDRSLAWNIQHRLLSRGAPLYQEAELMLREELREPRLYYSILRAISEGHTRASDIGARVLMPGARSDLTSYLTMLQELGLAEYRRPVVGGAVRRGTWSIADPYLRFWFRFVLPNRTVLDHGADLQQFYRVTVEPSLDQFVSKPAFEEICRAWILFQSNAGLLPPIERVGAWWGPVPMPTPDNPRRQGEGEIEVVAAAHDRVVLAGEAKWTRRPVGFGVLNELRLVLQSVPGVDDATRVALFARSFDERLLAAAPAEPRTLVSVQDLYA